MILGFLNKILSHFDLKIVRVPRTGTGLYIPPQDATHIRISVKGGGGGGAGWREVPTYSIQCPDCKGTGLVRDPVLFRDIPCPKCKKSP